MKVKGTYYKEDLDYEFCVEYEYYHKESTYDDPFEDRLDIKKATLNGMDITTFYWDYLNEDMFDEIYSYAVANKYENIL
jgi:hypothetical protein